MPVIRKENNPPLSHPATTPISPKVMTFLEEKNVTLSAILRMTRQEFSEVTRDLRSIVSEDERDSLIKFKADYMSTDEILAYNEPTLSENEELESNTDFPKFDPKKASFHT